MSQKVNLPKDEVIEMYKGGMTQKELADEYGCGRNLISRRLNTWEVDKTDRKGYYKYNLPKDEIIEMYKSGMSTYYIADEYGCSQVTISNRLDKWNVDTTQKLDLPKGKIIEMYKGGMSTYDIADKYNCDDTVIGDRLNEWDVKRRDNSFNYFKNQHKYIRYGEKSIAIHKLIAIAEYGLDSVEGKQVHHKNQVKWDNRPENLTLVDSSTHSSYHQLKRHGSEIPDYMSHLKPLDGEEGLSK